jgi:hypothetical protein
MAAEKNMREVVERLRAEGSEAMLELLEFHHVLEVFQQNLESIAPTVQELDLAASQIVDSGNEEVSEWNAVKDRTGRLSTWTNQFLVAFKELLNAVQVWNITDSPSGSILPTSGKRLVPRD